MKCRLLCTGLMSMCLIHLPAQDECPYLAENLEGDVWPVFEAVVEGGDGEVTFLDWHTLIAYVTGIRSPINVCDLTMADCAPRSNRGDGLITAADAIQAYRYSTGQDALQPTGGAQTNVVPTIPLPGLGPRSVQVIGSPIVRGVPNDLIVRLNSAGDELALAFTIEFDSSALRFVKALSSSTNVGVFGNTNAATNGRVALLAMNGSWPLNSPPQMDFVRLSFEVADWAATNAALSFSDAIAKREICNTNADPLSVTFEPAVFEIVTRQPQLVAPTVKASEFRFQFVGEIGGRYRIEASTNLLDWIHFQSFTNQFPTNQYSAPIVPEEPQRFYRAVMIR